MRHQRAEYGVLDGAVGGAGGGVVIAAVTLPLFPAAGLGGPWAFLNLASATIDQSWARYEGFHWLATPYGLFVHVLFCLCLGVAIAWAANRSFLWATLTGALVASGFWWVAAETWLPLLNPALHRAVPPNVVAAGHLALGLLVGLYLNVRGRTVFKEVQGMGNITNRSQKAEQQQQKKVKDRKAELLAKPGVNRARQDQAINQGQRADGHTLDRANEKLLP